LLRASQQICIGPEIGIGRAFEGAAHFQAA